MKQTVATLAEMKKAGRKACMVTAYDYTMARLVSAAGADMILMPDDLDLALEGVRTAVSDGTITMEELDSKVLKVLETKISYGII